MIKHRRRKRFCNSRKHHWCSKKRKKKFSKSKKHYWSNKKHKKRFGKRRKNFWWKKKQGRFNIYIKAKCSRGCLGKYEYNQVRKAVNKAIKNVIVEEEFA